MRKICLVFSLLIFLSSFHISFAQSDPQQKVDYELPYPGLLPDSPIYFLKIIRDKTVSFLIADSLKKAQYNLLQADKRLNAGIYLFNSAKSGTVQNPTKQNEKKINLAISTISKAENYFEEAIQKTKEANKEGMDIAEITRKLIDSSKKHRQVLISLEKESPQNFKANFKFQEKRSAGFGREVQSLILKR